MIQNSLEDLFGVSELLVKIQMAEFVAIAEGW